MPKGTVPARKLHFFFRAASAQRSFRTPRGVEQRRQASTLWFISHPPSPAAPAARQQHAP
eukprot:365250-Chlamydomonas_euryale.AAC.7